ncbi:hypothetical protein PVAND_001798 [Polypedilum vanderplanki]|uniref:Uncharacterized protein n=1 Tax=Polypedilum vanderplanki TaxID=319348 RepID=A0A9J6BPH5_POLVA|nr:hypothetical protein PVAND_001798 [Polypedilum vanderplanki]
MALSYLRRREIFGSFKSQTGDSSKIYSSLYSSIAAAQSSPVNNYESGGIFGLEFNYDGSILIAACEKKAVILYETTNRRPIKLLDDVHSDCVNCIKFLDERLFATCSDDSTVALYDMRNLKSKIRTLRGHSNWVKNIEYSKRDCLLVTSGFDGSIFTWDLNSYTENNLTYQKVFHTPGLMRCRLAPDCTKLVICTTGGYLIIIHDLDLSTLARDLQGFRPNLYRLMQVRRQVLPIASRYDHLFSKNQKTNRIELVSDFPKGNDAEVLSSLQIHPYGWCVLSRNNSYDESSEWTCVHDIQEIDTEDEEPAVPEMLQNFDNIPDGSETNSEIIPFSSNASNNSDTSNETSSTSDQSNRISNPNAGASYEEEQINDNEGQPQNAIDNDDEIQIIPYQPNLRPSLINTEEILDLWTGNIPFYQRSRRTLTERPYRINTGILSMNPRNIRRPNIKQNSRRLLYYCSEPNEGKGFIKELCFNNDGRLICSPFKKGIRLLSFNKECDELNVLLNHNYKNQIPPQKLHEIVVKPNQHSDIVVSTRFSPRAPICVSGCLNGKISWYQPI